ncbi:hypothetical protein [Vulcanisaeta thermophila]|nr:hypothetical protein [Vulcanisaeta thermophila]
MKSHEQITVNIIKDLITLFPVLSNKINALINGFKVRRPVIPGGC